VPPTTKSPIKDRAELVYLLTEAAEFEHSVMCSYLYALWTLKRSTDEGITAEELEAIDRWRGHHREMRSDLLSPTPTDYSSQGAQFPLPGIFAVTDLESAHRAIEEIVLQGEGAPAHREDSHYARFKSVRDELRALKEKRPEFEPARPAAVNPRLMDPLKRESCTLVSEPTSTRVVDLGNAIYTLMIRTFVQVFAPNPLPVAMRTALARVATELMYTLTTTGEAATRLPLKEGSDLAAGVTFELPGSVGLLVQRSAALILSERASELAAAARTIGEGVDLPGVAASLESIATKLAAVHRDFEETLTVGVGAREEPELAAPAAPWSARRRSSSPTWWGRGCTPRPRRRSTSRTSR